MWCDFNRKAHQQPQQHDQALDYRKQTNEICKADSTKAEHKPNYRQRMTSMQMSKEQTNTATTWGGNLRQKQRKSVNTDTCRERNAGGSTRTKYNSNNTTRGLLKRTQVTAPFEQKKRKLCSAISTASEPQSHHSNTTQKTTNCGTKQ